MGKRKKCLVDLASNEAVLGSSSGVSNNTEKVKKKVFRTSLDDWKL